MKHPHALTAETKNKRRRSDLADCHIDHGGAEAGLVNPLSWGTRGAEDAVDDIRRRVTRARAAHAVVKGARSFAWSAAAVA